MIYFLVLRDGRDQSDANHVSKCQSRVRQVELRTPEFVSLCVLSKLCVGITSVSYLLIDTQAILNTRYIDRCDMPKGMFTASISDIFMFLDFRIDCIFVSVNLRTQRD